ncbi:MAG: hypothetical protein QM526_02545 [Alphaproteobacteria bacterium]|nr:hypothetical protein [Alphaproteobacteria bacterium]
MGFIEGLIETVSAFTRDVSGSIADVLVGLVFVFFFYNAIQLIRSDDSKNRSAAVKNLLWSTVAIFLFVSIYGIFNFIQELFGIPTIQKEQFLFDPRQDIKSNYNQ